MSERPRPRNPLKPLRAPVPQPAARSRAALGLAAMAAEGRFALQVCAACGTAQYPPRDICVECLGDDLPWRDVGRGGTLVAETTTRVAGERYFRERTPWRSGLVKSEAGPILVVHLHRALAPGERVRLDLRLDHAGRGAAIAFPEDIMAATPDPALATFAADPRHRRILVTDGRAATGPALARAFREAGAATIFVGVADAWRPFDRGRLPDGAEIVPLDVTDSTSVGELAGRLGDKIDILVNNAAHVRPGSLVGGPLVGQGPVVAKETFETNCLGLMRLAAAFGPVMRARTAQEERTSAAFVNLVSAWALAPDAGYGIYAASQAAVRAMTAVLRAEARSSGLRVVDVLTGPIEDEWHQVLRPPKVSPAAVAAATVAALREGREEVIVGEVAREIHARWSEDPRLLRQETP